MEKIYLWNDKTIRTQQEYPSITPMLIDSESPCPAVLIIPGGGYSCVCSATEGFPIAEKFNSMGFHTFILDYRTYPDLWPKPQLDAMRAMKIIRANAHLWQVDPRRIAVCGFSAGAHLAGSLGTICDRLDASNGDAADQFPYLPNAMILCYGVLAFTEWSHIGSQKMLAGEKFEEMRHDLSLIEHVNDNTPPTFLMHTIRDQVVSYRNSLEFADAMAKFNRPCELNLFYWGDHGMLLGKDTLDVTQWPENACNFLKSLERDGSDPNFKQRYTHAYQAERC